MTNIRHPVLETMPCEPSELDVPRYAFPMLFGNSEMEEAAARVLTLAQKRSGWSGIAWREIAQQMLTDFQRYRASRTYVDRLNSYRRSQRIYALLCTVTLGAYKLIAMPPKPPSPEQDPRKIPFSSTYFFGPGLVVTGLDRLTERGLLRKEMVGEGEEAETVFYPTSKLVAAVMNHRIN